MAWFKERRYNPFRLGFARRRKEISAVINCTLERYHTLKDVKLLPDDFTQDAFRELFGFEYDLMAVHM